jgi:hypothetical protein
MTNVLTDRPTSRRFGANHALRVGLCGSLQPYCLVYVKHLIDYPNPQASPGNVAITDLKLNCSWGMVHTQMNLSTMRGLDDLLRIGGYG